MMKLFLSIAIPTFNRSEQLVHALDSISNQLLQCPAGQVEIIVVDDNSTDDTENRIRAYAENKPFIKYFRHKKNIGLERNLIECGKFANGEYLWIFGDDDYLETDDALNIILNELYNEKYDVLVVNRTRRNKDLLKLLSKNWMRFDANKTKSYKGLVNFCHDWGLISVIGFITVNIFKRKEFFSAENEKYFGTMYPQLGMMLSAFSRSPCLLIGKPLICHRTQTAEEKEKAFICKEKEKDFMSSVVLRNAKYFGFPFIRMLSELISSSSIKYSDLDAIQENTVINGYLTEFLISNVELAVNLGIVITDTDWKNADQLFSSLTLSESQILRLSIFKGIYSFDHLLPLNNPGLPTISVITPSFNQAKFLPQCLQSVNKQTYRPIEHIVLDPGSSDGSREIARNYKHVTLVSEKDSGQGDAVAKGIQMAKGDIVAWVNSDDLYNDNKVFERIIDRFIKPDSPDIVYGRGTFIDENGQKQREVYVNSSPETLPWRLQQEDGILQPSVFFKREIIKKVGNISSSYEFCMDYEFWIRCVKENIKFVFVNSLLSKAHYHSDNKTFGQRGSSYKQVCGMLLEHFGYVNHIWLKRYAEYKAEGLDGVLAHPQNTIIKSHDQIYNEYIGLLKEYNLNAETIFLLEKYADKKGYGDTLKEMVNLELLPEKPYKQVPLDKDSRIFEFISGFTTYLVGDRRWSFSKAWKNNQIKKSHKFFTEMQKQRSSDTCVVVCNGPSLNKVDPELLDGYDVIVSNNIFYNDQILSRAKFLTVVNYLVAEQSANELNNIEGVYKIFPFWLRFCISDSENTFFVNAKGFPEFSTNIFKNISWRHTVTFYNLQLAYGLGYKKVVLVGCDHYYTQPKNINEQDIIQSEEPDTNHFDARYFKGKRWEAADVNNMEKMYKLSKVAFENDNREIVNCTDGGHLELFRRSSLKQELPVLTTNTHDLNKADPSLAGPFKREENVHFDETILIRDYIGIKSNGVMVDVGAHHGYASKPFHEKNWKIFAFEPDPNNRKILESQFSGQPNICISKNAVSDVSGEDVPFYASDESTGISGLSAFREGHKEICHVRTITLRDFCEIHKITNIDFLKIDTEGFDLMVLKGVPWDKIHPDIIECEFEDLKTENLGYSFNNIAGFLVEKGYEVYVSEWHPIIRYGISHDWHQLKKYPCHLGTNNAWGNLLAFKGQPDEAVLVKLLKDQLVHSKSNFFTRLRKIFG